MKRLYFVLPDLQSAQQILNDLLLARVEERHIHFMGKENLDALGLPEAQLIQSSDLVHGAELGLIVGGATGIVAGLIFALFPPVGDGPLWGVWLGVSLFAALFGAWVGSMLGSSTPNVKLKRFQKAIERGEVLLMVDIPRARVDEIDALISQHHPEVQHQGLEPTIPAFP